MKEIHGVVAVKVAYSFADDEQAVRITDEHSGIILSLSSNSHNAMLTAEEARYLAKQLVQAAQRLDAKQKP